MTSALPMATFWHWPLVNDSFNVSSNVLANTLNFSDGLLTTC